MTTRISWRSLAVLQPVARAAFQRGLRRVGHRLKDAEKKAQDAEAFKVWRNEFLTEHLVYTLRELTPIVESSTLLGVSPDAADGALERVVTRHIAYLEETLKPGGSLDVDAGKLSESLLAALWRSQLIEDSDEQARATNAGSD